jgi:hypothetical protein
VLSRVNDSRLFSVLLLNPCTDLDLNPSTLLLLFSLNISFFSTFYNVEFFVDPGTSGGRNFAVRSFLDVFILTCFNYCVGFFFGENNDFFSSGFLFPYSEAPDTF